MVDLSKERLKKARTNVQKKAARRRVEKKAKRNKRQRNQEKRRQYLGEAKGLAKDVGSLAGTVAGAATAKKAAVKTKGGAARASTYARGKYQELADRAEQDLEGTELTTNESEGVKALTDRTEVGAPIAVRFEPADGVASVHKFAAGEGPNGENMMEEMENFVGGGGMGVGFGGLGVDVGGGFGSMFSMDSEGSESGPDLDVGFGEDGLDVGVGLGGVGLNFGDGEE